MKDNGPLRIQRLIVGELGANCYVLGCRSTGKGAVIDPGGDADAILSVIEESRLDVGLILNTHGHFDHFGANGPLKDATGAAILIHRADAEALTSDQARLWGLLPLRASSPPADRYMDDGELIEVGEARLEVRHTPGHSPGGVCLVGDGVVFTGDTLFGGSVGRTDLPGGSEATLIRSIRTQLLTLGDDTVAYPGHGETTTIGYERRHNPFL